MSALRKRQPAPKTPSASVFGTIYLVWAEGTQCFKIGFTRSSVGKRICSIQGDCPFNLRIVGITKGSMLAESLLHSRLNRYRMNGEWFMLPEEAVWALINEFQQYTPNGLNVNRNLPSRNPEPYTT